VGDSELTPVETALPTDTMVVSAKCVVETGSRSKDFVFRDHERLRLSGDPTLKERTLAVSR